MGRAAGTAGRGKGRPALSCSRTHLLRSSGAGRELGLEHRPPFIPPRHGDIGWARRAAATCQPGVPAITNKASPRRKPEAPPESWGVGTRSRCLVRVHLRNTERERETGAAQDRASRGLFLKVAWEELGWVWGDLQTVVWVLCLGMWEERGFSPGGKVPG